MSHRFTPAIRLLSVLMLALLVFSQGAQAAPSAPAAPTAVEAALLAQLGGKVSGSTRSMYIVQVAGEPLASYKGGVAGLAPTSPSVTGERKLNLKGSATQAYRAHLAAQRAAVLEDVYQVIGHKVTVPYEYDAAYHGFALELTADQAREVAKLPNVTHIEQEVIYELHTDAGPTWIKADRVWTAQDTNIFVATILGANEVPANASAASGSGTFVLNGTTLNYNIQVSGVTINAAHIHVGAAGINGPVAHTLTPTAPGTYIGQAALSAGEVTQLRASGLYVNFHSTAFPGGEVRGQITGSKGEGMIAGIIDTGINFSHPSFAAKGGDGYTHINPYGAGTYKGVCDPNSPQHQPAKVCNSKLVGGYTWPSTIGTAGSPEDDNGHGSHTASTTAGNVVTTTTVLGVATGQVSGVAPHANIIIYDGCGPLAGSGCPGAATLASTNQSVLDGVDVLNYSIGGASFNPWASSGAIAFLNAREGGVYVAASAGNSGSGATTQGAPSNAPWITATAATEHNRAFLGTLGALTKPGGPNLPNIDGKSYTNGASAREIIYAGAAPFNNPFCSPGFPTGTNFGGKIVVCDRGGTFNGAAIGRVAKGQNVLALGAGGMVLINDAPNAAAVAADAHVLPAIHISFAAGTVLKTWLATGTGHQASIEGRNRVTNSPYTDMVAGFSSRGPDATNEGVLKPDLAAPGVDIIAAYFNDGNAGNGPDFNMISGTSMASPHNAGAAALVRQLHPSWSASQVQSALMTTSIQNGIRKENNLTPATPFDRGAGRIDVSRAVMAGLVLHETRVNYLAANPANGGDPEALNIASFQNTNCVSRCSWTRTVSNTLSVPATWTASFTSTTSLAVAVSPATFTIPAGGTRTFTVTATPGGADFINFSFATLLLTEATNKAPVAAFPVAVKPVASNLPPQLNEFAFGKAGSLTTDPIISAFNSTGLNIRKYGLTKAILNQTALPVDPTNATPYDNMTIAGGVYSKTITVPAGTKRLVFEITDTPSTDLDLFIHRDADGNGIPVAGEQVCVAATGEALEYCNMNEPAAGTYIILVQNWEASSTGATDPVTLAEAAVPTADAGNWTVTGPATVQRDVPFTLNVSWAVLDAQPGDHYYGTFDVGSSSETPGNLGRTNFDLAIEAADHVLYLPIVSRN